MLFRFSWIKNRVLEAIEKGYNKQTNEGITWINEEVKNGRKSMIKEKELTK